MDNLDIKILNEKHYGNGSWLKYTDGIILESYKSFIVAPKTEALIPLGVTFKIPKGYILDVKLAEELVDKAVGVIGYTFVMKDKDELAVMIFNYNKQSVRIEESDEIVTLNLIKVADDVKVNIVD